MTHRILFTALISLLFISTLLAQESKPLEAAELAKKINGAISTTLEQMNADESTATVKKPARQKTVYVKYSGKEPTAEPEQKQEEEHDVVSNLVTLSEGNKRFISGNVRKINLSRQRESVVAGQHPYAVVITCSDSRVPPELIFDESLGRLFVIRVAGNVVDPIVLGSIEYAVEHLHSSIVLFLGHDSCGAVKAAMASGEIPPNIGAIAKRIQPAVERIKKKNTGEQELYGECVKENVREQIRLAVHQSGILFDEMVKGNVLILGGIYELKTGKVRFLSGE
jgi:carbonic anhydrase